MQQFANLRTDKSKQRWSVDTFHRAPYKPLLLLSILDHIATKIITRNFIEPTFELAQTFQEYLSSVLPIGKTGSMSYPFYHMEDSFWELVPQPGNIHQRGLTVSSVKRLRELYLGARFDDDLYPLLLMETHREKIRRKLIQTYFSPLLQLKLIEQGITNKASTDYSQTLLKSKEVQPPFYTSQKPKVRDQGFRKAIVKLYNHRCALCGIRMLTPEGHTVIDAAHIKPWSESHNDHPTNGLALCKLCHWSFDEGFMAVGKSYNVMVSSIVRKDKNLPGHMLSLSDRPIFRPSASESWPDQESCQWHREKRFKP